MEKESTQDQDEQTQDQDEQTIDEFIAQLKGFIPSRLSREEIGEAIDFVRENAKNLPEFLYEEHQKHLREISKPPNKVRRKSVQDPSKVKNTPQGNPDEQLIDEFEAQLKGIIPRRASREEGRETIELIRENAKNLPQFLIDEHEKHLEEISKPPDPSVARRSALLQRFREKLNTLLSEEEQPTDEFYAQLKGIIAPRLSAAHARELLEWIQENTKQISKSVIEGDSEHAEDVE